MNYNSYNNYSIGGRYVKRMYKFFCLTTIMCSILVSFHVNAQDVISIKIDEGKLQDNDITYIEKGITMVPLRMVSQGLGAKVHYDQQTKQISILKEKNIIKLKLNSNTAILNDQHLNLPIDIISKNGTTMVPLRFICESLNSEVKYHEENNIICINSNGHKDNCIMEQNIAEAYMLAIDTIYEKDPALNHEIKYLAIDTRKMNYLSERVNQELRNYLSKYKLDILETNYEELKSLGFIQDGSFTEGILITIDDSNSVGEKLILNIDKFRSSLGAIGCSEMIIEKIEDEWEVTSTSKWYMS